MQSTYIFNQYYIDFLKRLKKEAKQKQDDELSQHIVKTIKENYTTLDKKSDEYVLFLKQQISDEKWDSFIEDSTKWFEENKEIQIYTNVTIENIMHVFEDEYLCSHFVSVFYIFSHDLSEEVSTHVIKILQSIDIGELIASIEDEKIRKVLENLQTLRNKKIKEKSGIDMKFIENTSIGKLAKEILEDINVEKLQKSIGENGSVLKAIGDPNSGFSDIITNVSQKMAKKISDGDLSQENLFEDAMKFASSMPGLFGQNMGGGKGGKSSKGAPDMSGLMSMMSSMMGNMGNMDGMENMFKNMANNQNVPKGYKRGVNENALKKLAKAKQLKKKLREKEKLRQSTEKDTTENLNDSDE